MNTEIKAKPSKYATTQCNHYKRVIESLKSIYSMAKSYGMTGVDIDCEIKKYVYDTNSFKRMGKYWHAHFCGYHECLFANLYQYELVWLHSYKNGSGVTIGPMKYDDIPQPIDYAALEGHFYWKDLHNGAYKIYR